MDQPAWLDFPRDNGDRLRVAEVIITGELSRRLSREPDHEAENRALRALAEAMVTEPETVLQRLVEAAMALTGSDSAGISLLEPGGAHGIFRWVAATGAFAHNLNGTMPREASPCGEVIARDEVLLLNEGERVFPALRDARPKIYESLLAPFYIDGKPAGTVWALKHSPQGRFEREDARILQSLAHFASIAHQMVQTVRALERAREAGRRNEELRRIALEGGRMGAWRWDCRTRLGWGDAECLALWGVPLAIGSHPISVFTSRMAPESATAVEAVMAKEIAPGEEFDAQVEIAAGPAAGRWLRWRGRAERERPWVIDGVSFDVTEQRLAEQRLRESEERQAFLLTLSDALRPLGDPVEVQDVAARLVGEHLGSDRACYIEIEPAQDLAVITREYLRGEAVSLRGRHPISAFRFGVDQSREGRPVVWTDIPRDPRLPDSERPSYAALSIVSAVNVPLIKDGELVAILTVTNAQPRDWMPGEIALLEDVAERTWAAMQRASAEAKLRERAAWLAAQKEAFQAAVNGAPLRDSLGVLIRTALAQGDGNLHCAFYMADESGTALRHVTGMPEPYALCVDGFRIGSDSLACGLAVSIGQPVVTADVTKEPKWEPWLWLAEQYAYRAVWSFPLATSAGKVIGTLAMYFSEPREATPRDYEFATVLTRAAAIIISRHREAEERERAEAALRESEARLRALVEGIPQLAWRAVDGGVWTWASPQWVAYTGHPEPEGRDLGWLDAVHPEDRGEVAEAWRDAEARGTFRADHRLFHAGEGRHRWVQSQATPVRGADRIVEWLGTTTDVEDLRRLQEERILVAELQHRTRNLLTVVSGIAEQTLAASASLDEFGPRFDQRLAALGRVQGLLSRGAEPNVTADELVRLELAAHGVDPDDADRVRLGGPRVALPARVVQLLALALHELMTNALKHGALGRAQGRLDIAWREERGTSGEGTRLRLDWKESGVALGVDVSAVRRGFGLDLIEFALPYELDGETRLTLTPEGVRCTIDLPIDDATAALGAAGP